MAATMIKPPTAATITGRRLADRPGAALLAAGVCADSDITLCPLPTAPPLDSLPKRQTGAKDILRRQMCQKSATAL